MYKNYRNTNNGSTGNLEIDIQSWGKVRLWLGELNLVSSTTVTSGHYQQNLQELTEQSTFTN